MAQSDNEVQHECTYLGSHEEIAPKCTDTRTIPPSADFAKAVALRVLGGRTGRYHASQHFRKRSVEREFDVFDVEYVIRNGSCIGAGKYCAEHRNCKYTFSGDIDGTGFDAAFALSAEHDLVRSPLMVLITGCFKTRSGKRKKAF